MNWIYITACQLHWCWEIEVDKVWWMKWWRINDNSLHVNVDTLYVQHNVYTVSPLACTHKKCRVCMYYIEYVNTVCTT